MLPAYKGRINRKTFVLGNLIGLAALGFAALIYIVPLALIDIVVNGSEGSVVFRALYGLFVVPAIFYFFYFSVLFVRRLHDVGMPGMLLFWSFILLMGCARLLDIWILNVVALAILAAVVLLPGQKRSNAFGAKPGPKFRLASLVIKF